MKRIPLTQGQFAIVDDDMYDYLKRWKWYSFKSRHTYYAVRRIKGGAIRMHRQILGLSYKDGLETDHKNHNGLDNRIHNLRSCTKAQNQYNQKAKKHSSKYKGVWWSKDHKKWVSRIQYKGKQLHIGYFQSETKAATSYDRKAKELFGEFAQPNFESSPYIEHQER